jgi:hypothetical protein
MKLADDYITINLEGDTVCCLRKPPFLGGDDVSSYVVEAGWRMG